MFALLCAAGGGRGGIPLCPASSPRLRAAAASPAMCTADGSETAPRVTDPPPAAEHGQQELRQAAPDESREIIASARSILDREQYFVREVDRYLRHQDFLNLRKKEILYKKWLEDVSEPLLGKIEDKMDSQSRKEIQKRREEQLSLYLNYCKKKGFVALETYDPSEYDPLFLKTRTDCWKVSVPALQDPLLKAVQKKFTETGIAKQCETGRPCSSRELQELPLLPQSRQRMSAIEWLRVPHAYIASELHRTRSHSAAIHLFLKAAWLCCCSAQQLKEVLRAADKNIKAQLGAGCP